MNVTLDTDGPRTPEYVQEVARAHAESARVLAHLTMSGEAVPSPPDVNRIIGHLQAAAESYRSILSNLSQQLTYQNAADMVRMAHGTTYEGNPDEAVTATWQALDQAMADAMQLQDRLGVAANITSAMEGAGDE
jgi:hypothetical protein